MRKSCKNCRNYRVGDQYCKENNIQIIDKMGATYCTQYKEKRKVPKGNVKCIYCANMNKYGWCIEKKKCFNEDEKEQERQCVKFRQRKKKQQKNKKYLKK